MSSRFRHGAALGLVTLALGCSPREPVFSTGRSRVNAEAEPSAYALASSLAREVGPRLAGSKGDAAAVAWAEKTMRSLGFPVVRREPVTVPVWVRKAERAELVTATERTPLAVTALGWSYGTGPAGITAHVVEVGSVESIERIPEATLTGAIVFCNVPMERTASGEGYGKAVPTRAKCALEAEKKHAVAALIRSIGTDETDHPHTGSMRREGAKIPSAALSVASAKRLSAALAKSAQEAGAGRASTLQVSLVLDTERLPDAQSANVVAEIPGTKRKDEIVVVGAHLDSWDLGQGAVDDGAGVGIVLAAARAFVNHPGERTLRVVLFAAEENSLAGGKAYAEAHRAEHHVAALELDAGTGLVVELRARAGRAITLPNVPGVKTSSEPAEGGADISPLRQLGVPMLDARQDMSDYFDVHHTAADTVDKLRPASLAQATSTVETLLRFATDAGVDFGTLPEAERERSR